MIDYYREHQEINDVKVIDRLEECIQHYREQDLSFDALYEEYDRVDNARVKREFTDKNVFFRKGKQSPSGDVKVKSLFMKECLLEALKIVCERKAEVEMAKPSSDLNEEINTYKKDFQYYPDVTELDFADQLFAKEELHRHGIPDKLVSFQNKCDSDFFELAPHQLFLKNYFSPNTPYQSILLFHGVGVGKSCSAVSIAENFKDIYGHKDKRSIILASQNIQYGWQKTIFDPSKDDDQCTGDTYDLDGDTKGSIRAPEKKAKKKIKQFYELHGYMAFAGTVKKYIEQGLQGITDPKEKHERTIELIREKYSNRVLIIDEVHNIRTNENQPDTQKGKTRKKEIRKTIKYIELVIKHSQNLKLILLTANPMFNNAQEIVWILNMLLMNDGRQMISEDDIFDRDSPFHPPFADILRDKFRGYVSYLRGENPVSFPIRIYPQNKKHPLMIGLNKARAHDLEHADSRHESLTAVPTIDLFMNEIPEQQRLSFLQLYPSAMLKDGHQETLYQEAIKKHHGAASIQIQDETKLLQMANIIYPGTSDIRDCYGETGLENCFDVVRRSKSISYRYKSSILNDETIGPFLHVSRIEQYSTKIKAILDAIEISEGIVFIYSNWIGSGVLPLILALEQNGYQKYDGKKMLDTRDAKVKSMIHSQSQGKFMVISGSEIMTPNLEEEMKVVTHPDNKDGSKIKIIIGSTVASEGLDFKCVRSIHVLEPWHNINKLEQVIGRGIRNCSHKYFDESEADKRNITIYLHNVMTSDPNIETIDAYLYRYAEQKSAQIGNIETILKQSAIDRYLFRHANYLSEKDVETVMVDPAAKDHKKFRYSPHDRAFTRTSSFSENVDYMKDATGKPDRPKDKNKDTFHIQYSEALIEVYKKRIFNLFKEETVLTLDYLIERLREYEIVYEDFLYYALNEMIIEKYPMYNKNDDRGYLVHMNDLFIFQPYFNEDKFLPLYYRLNRGDTRSNELLITSNERRLATVILEPRTFPMQVITDLYESIINYEFKLPDPKRPKILTETHILKMLKLDRPHFIRYAYIIDRKTFDERIILLYSILGYLHGDLNFERDIEHFIKEFLVPFFEPLFLYYDKGKFAYFPKYNDRNKDKLVGAFLYHHINKKPIFYRYEDKQIKVFDRVDEINIVQTLEKAKKDKSLAMTGSWGYTTYSDCKVCREEHNGIVLKAIKSTDALRKNYVYPPGPGIVCLNEGVASWRGNSTAMFIQTDLRKYYDALSEADQQALTTSDTTKNQKNKKARVMFIELCFRMRRSFIQSDLIFLKYY